MLNSHLSSHSVPSVPSIRQRESICEFIQLLPCIGVILRHAPCGYELWANEVCQEGIEPRDSILSISCLICQAAHYECFEDYAASMVGVRMDPVRLLPISSLSGLFTHHSALLDC